MARRIRRRGGRRGLRKRAVRRGKSYVAVGRRGLVGSGVHRFKETCLWSGTISAPNNNTNQGLMTFTLNDLVNVASFKALFDLYKITGVKVRIVPRWSSGDVLAAQLGQAGFPMLYMAENRDPYVPAPTSVGDILNDDGVKIMRLNRPYSMYLKNPKPEIRDANGVSLPFQFNSSSKALQPWLTTGGNAQSVDQSIVPHSGYRWYLDNTLCSQPVTFQVYTTYYFTMKEQD